MQRATALSLSKGSERRPFRWIFAPAGSAKIDKSAVIIDRFGILDDAPFMGVWLTRS